MPSKNPNIMIGGIHQYLLSEVTKLKALLEDPHPGLAPWVEMYCLHMENISDFWNDKEREEPTNAQ